ncbi:MAG: hypothetical protein ACK4HB_08215 [Candidatus Bipolaricaulia bacterium]
MARVAVLSVLLWGMFIVFPALTAPITGDAQLELVMKSSSCDVNEDRDLLVDEDPPNGVDDDGDTLIDEDVCRKIDLGIFKVEMDVVLTLSISGLEITSTSVLTFKGVEYQAFATSAALGALTLKNILVFAPGITEIEFVRTSELAHLRYCVRRAAPGDVTPPFRDCPLPDSYLYWLLEDVGFYHPTVANLALAQAFDAGGMLDADLTLRKSVFDLALPVGGLLFSLHAMAANFGTVTPEFRMGFVLGVEGQTASGLTVRSETWVGARQGLECFAECKPLERLYGGIVIDELSPQEEKLFVRNLKLWGITLHARAEFQLFGETDLTGRNCSTQVICLLEINAIGQVHPLNLTLTNTLRLGPGLDAKFNVLTTTLKIGDAAVEAFWEFYPDSIGAWKVYLAQVVGSFDPPGVQVRSEIKFCTGVTLVLCDTILKHTLVLAWTVGDFRGELRVIFLGLIKDFYQAWWDGIWKVGPVELTSSAVLTVEYISALAVGIKVRF